MRSLLLALALVAAPAAAQSSAEHVASLSQHDSVTAPRVAVTGTFSAADATLRITGDARSLAVALEGQAAFDAFAEAPLHAPANDRNAQAEGLLRDAFAGATGRLADALPAHRRATGTADFVRLLDALEAERGAVVSVTALGTLADGRHTATLVRVVFAEGEEVLKLKWRDGALALVTRGTLPTATALAVPGAPTRFAVLGADGTTATTLHFGDDRVTARGPHAQLAAERTR